MFLFFIIYISLSEWRVSGLNLYLYLLFFDTFFSFPLVTSTGFSNFLRRRIAEALTYPRWLVIVVEIVLMVIMTSDVILICILFSFFYSVKEDQHSITQKRLNPEHIGVTYFSMLYYLYTFHRSENSVEMF